MKKFRKYLLVASPLFLIFLSSYTHATYECPKVDSYVRMEGKEIPYIDNDPRKPDYPAIEEALRNAPAGSYVWSSVDPELDEGKRNAQEGPYRSGSDDIVYMDCEFLQDIPYHKTHYQIFYYG